MVDYQNGQLGQAVVRCVSKAIRHGADYAIIHHPDVVGIPVVEWWPRKKGSASFVQVSCFSYHSHIHETEGQLAIVHRAMYQFGRRTEDPKLSPPAPCIPGSRPLFCFPPFNLAGFSLISPACYHFRTSTSHPPYPSLPVFSLFTPSRQRSFGPFWRNFNMGWT